MKRHVLCIFGLIFWLLGFCTFLSMRIEELMVPTVTVTEPDLPRGSNDGQLPLDCLFDGVLYQIDEGSGWEKGTRASAVDPGMYEVLPDRIKMSWGKIIRYATKTPRSGEPVSVAQKQDKRDDHWLAVSADGKALPALGELDESVKIEEQTDRALLFSVSNVPQPFMEKRARSMAPILPGEDDFTPWTNDAGEIDWEAVDWEALEEARPKPPNFYSLNDLEQLLRELPKLGLLAGIVLCAVILWAGCWGLSRRARQNRARLVFLAGGMAALLAASAILIRTVELPSSLLPVDNILAFSHYRQELGLIFSGLKALVPVRRPAAELLSLSGAKTRLFWLCLAGGGAAGAVLSAAVIRTAR